MSDTNDGLNSTGNPVCPKWTKVTLVASLAINLAIVGAIVGASFREHQIAGTRIDAPDAVNMITRALPPAQQRELREALRDQRINLHPEPAELRALRERYIRALLSEPVDIEAVAEVLRDQRLMMNKLNERGHSAVLKQFEAMTLAERRDYVERLRGGNPRPPRPNANGG